MNRKEEELLHMQRSCFCYDLCQPERTASGRCTKHRFLRVHLLIQLTSKDLIKIYIIIRIIIISKVRSFFIRVTNRQTSLPICPPPSKKNPVFHDPEKEVFGNIVGKGENAGNHAGCTKIYPHKNVSTMQADMSRYFLANAFSSPNPFTNHASLLFIFQLREYPCNITHDILFLIYNGYF